MEKRYKSGHSSEVDRLRSPARWRSRLYYSRPIVTPARTTALNWRLLSTNNTVPLKCSSNSNSPSSLMRRPLSSSPSSCRELYLFTSKQPSLSFCLLSSVISCKRSQRNTFKEFRTLKFPPPSSKKKLSGRFVRSSVFSCLRAQDRGGTFSLKDKALNSSKICVFTKNKKGHINFLWCMQT